MKFTTRIEATQLVSLFAQISSVKVPLHFNALFALPLAKDPGPGTHKTTDLVPSFGLVWDVIGFSW